MNSEAVLERYRKWLYWYVSHTYPSRYSQWHDLMQEGWIAMWKALSKFDPAKGAEATYLTTAAKLRLSDVVRRETWTGAIMSRGHTREQPATPVDHHEDWVESKLECTEAYHWVELAYHRGEILRALDALPVKEKHWVVVNILEDAGRYSWRDAARRMKPSTMETLQQQLAHLA